MTDDFQNALAWFRSAPSDWIDSGKKSLSAGAEWVWEVLQGDFNDDASNAQIAVGTVISMIPFVDQICDVRDVVANCKKIHHEPNNNGHWISISLTLIGLFPGIGSLFKGCFKVIFASLRKAGALSGITPRMALKIDEALFALNRFLTRPEVVASLKALKWDNPYKILAKKLREIAAKINAGTLMEAFKEVRNAIGSLLGMVQRWGSESMAAKAVAQLKVIDDVTRNAYRELDRAVKHVSDCLLQLARRLEVDADMAHRAYLHTVNPHSFKKLSESESALAFARAKPGWVDSTGKLVYRPLDIPPVAPPGWTSTAPDPKRGRHQLDNAHETFHTIKAVTLPPGTTLYRIVDPTSRDNSICWVTEAEFMKLKSKDDWRRRLAVWAHWNSNGEFVTYTIPPGAGLNVWEGVTASQKMKGTDYVLEGGAIQIVVDPAHLEKSLISPRKKTNWGYDDLGSDNNLVGVPVQRNNWSKN
jgi:hypothetical protein